MFHLLDTYSAGISLLCSALFEAIAVSWFYGEKRLTLDFLLNTVIKVNICVVLYRFLVARLKAAAIKCLENLDFRKWFFLIIFTKVRPDL